MKNDLKIQLMTDPPIQFQADVGSQYFWLKNDNDDFWPWVYHSLGFQFKSLNNPLNYHFNRDNHHCDGSAQLVVQVGLKFHDCDFFYNPCQAGPCFAQWTLMMIRLMMTMQSDYDNDEVVPHLDRLELLHIST